jgi:TonB family protein
MPLGKLGSMVLVVATAAMGWASTGHRSPRTTGGKTTLLGPEQQFWTAAVHASNFSPMTRASVRSACEPVEPPMALATPDPLFDRPVPSTKVTVSFIVGIDGRVHSPLILESLGPSQDRIVLDAVRNWRYRPATCNGVPTEAEGKIAFSSR